MLYLAGICIQSSIMSSIGWKSIGLSEGVFWGLPSRTGQGGGPRRLLLGVLRRTLLGVSRICSFPVKSDWGLPISTGGGWFWHVGLGEGLLDCSLSSFSWSFPKQPPQLDQLPRNNAIQCYSNATVHCSAYLLLLKLQRASDRSSWIY